MQLLLPAEAARLYDYVDKYQNFSRDCCEPPDLVVHLGDSPATGWCTWSAVSCALPTIRRCGSLYFSPFYGRQVLLREMFCAMGYPTFGICHLLSNLPQSQAYRVFVPKLSWFDMRRGLGNAMHVAQIGTFAGAMLLCTRLNAHDFTLAELMETIDSAMK